MLCFRRLNAAFVSTDGSGLHHNGHLFRRPFSLHHVLFQIQTPCPSFGEFGQLGHAFGFEHGAGLFGELFDLSKVDFAGAVLRPMAGNVVAHRLLLLGLGVFEDEFEGLFFDKVHDSGKRFQDVF